MFLIKLYILILSIQYCNTYDLSTTLNTLPSWYPSDINTKIQYPNQWTPANSIIQVDSSAINSSLNLPDLSFHGRYLEDRIAAELFFFNTTNGLMVEVGANDGYIFSSSYVFDKELKWRTIIIEGDPIISYNSPFYRPNALSINAIVCDRFKLIHFSSMGAVGGIVESMNDEFASVWHPSLTRSNTSNTKIVPENVAQFTPLLECVSLGWILSELRITQIDLMTVDLVGGELNALKSIDFNKIKLNVIAVSFNPIYKLSQLYIDSIVDHITKQNQFDEFNIDIKTTLPISWKTFDQRPKQMKWFVRREFIPSKVELKSMTGNPKP